MISCDARGDISVRLDRKAGQGFCAHRFGTDEIRRLPDFAAGRDESTRALLPLLAALGRRPAGDYHNLSALCAQERLPFPDDTETLLALEKLFIDVADRKLQALYRDHFRRVPPPATQDARVAALAAVADEARAIVESYDWKWLADWLELGRIGESAGHCVRKLANFAFPVRRVNFRFTHHCNIACRHCYNSSGPHEKARRIGLDAMLAIIAEMRDAGIGALNLTGGEPFLYPDHLAALIRAGRAARLHTISIYTNAFWAADAARAERMLARLADAGLMRTQRDHLKVSTGVHHQEFIPFANVAILAERYHAMFDRPLRVDCELSYGDDKFEAAILRQIAERGLEDRVSLTFRNTLPLGRGAGLAFDATTIDEPCHAIDEIAFDPDSSVRPCCGLNSDNRGVVIGRLGTDGLRALVKRMQNDAILQFLATHPMEEIFDHVPRLGDRHAGTCHLCQNAIGHMTDREELAGTLSGGQRYYPFWFRAAKASGA